VCFLAERSAAMSASEWRAFWQDRGLQALAGVLEAAWSPFAPAGGDARETCSFRIASLLVSRASAKALADELARIRGELGDEPSPLDDARAGRAVADWFDEATGA
jgi:hypothetical protein